MLFCATKIVTATHLLPGLYLNSLRWSKSTTTYLFPIQTLIQGKLSNALALKILLYMS